MEIVDPDLITRVRTHLNSWLLMVCQDEVHQDIMGRELRFRDRFGEKPATMNGHDRGLQPTLFG